MSNNYFKNTIIALSSLTLFAVMSKISAGPTPRYYRDMPDDLSIALPVDSPDTPEPEPQPELKYKFKDDSELDPANQKKDGGLKLKDPSNITTETEYDPATGTYNVKQKMGTTQYRPATYLEKQEYIDQIFRQNTNDYWRQRSKADALTQQNTKKSINPRIRVGGRAFEQIFGTNTIDIRPQGSAELMFGLNTNRTDNPAVPIRQRKVTIFDFNEKIQLNVVGNIGDKLKVTTSYNTQATFDFENQMKLEFTGHEDDIIKKIEAGNVSLPLTGTLITGSQSLFGLKTQLQFGKLTATTIFSQQRGKSSEIEVKGGAQSTKFEVNGDAYEANRHYLLGHFFRDQYNSAMSQLPLINSGVMITKMEVWVTNRINSTENLRNIVAFSDLGEDIAHVNQNALGFITDSTGKEAANGANSLYHLIADKTTGLLSDRNFQAVTGHLSAIPNQPLQISRDYERVLNARRLSPNEYTINQRLGFISLNQPLNYDEVLGVAFQYTLGGKTYQVGEFSTDGLAGQQPLYVKMLKSTTVNTQLPIWDLMMKNIYSLGAYQVNPQDFKLDIIYGNIETGVDINYLPAGPVNGKPLIQVQDMDRLNVQKDPIPDGVFDFIEGVTIYGSNGRVIFSHLEPFGELIAQKLNDPLLANKYAFRQLYDETRVVAQQSPQLNRFKLRGSYQSSSSSDISLNAMNIPQGSVVVSAGAATLSENVDYTVDYTLGRVKILNEGILKSGTPIKIKVESNSLFAIQQKRLIGTHLDYKVNKDFILGGTILNLTERPLTQKVTFGDEPVSNTIWGFDGNYKTETPFITRLLDRLPLYSTKEMSNTTISGEFAHLIPGHSKAIGKAGNSYIDDFEGSQSTIDLRQMSNWFLASTPQGQPGLFPEGNLNDSLPYGYNRARLAWYVMDPLFYRQTNGLTPDYLSSADMSNHFVREVLENEIFPNKQPPNGQPINTAVLDLAYYPDERGPYNYDVAGIPGISAGINADGSLKKPETRWAGIMRSLQTTDFQASNVQFIQFWMMDPYNEDNPVANQNTTGELYFNLGNISEDILKDSRQSIENGLPIEQGSASPPYSTTKWGHVPTIPPPVIAFDNNPDSRQWQDVGYDGLQDVDERNHFANYLNDIQNLYGANSGAYTEASADPSTDNYTFFRGDLYDQAKTPVLLRYKKYNGVEGNSPTEQYYSQLNADKYPTTGTTIPNIEDINRDNTLSESEGYYQYKIKLTPSDINPANMGNNYITNVFKTTVNTKDGQSRPITWYQFKIPIDAFEEKIGNIEGFNAIRFMRVFFKGVNKPVICRMARLELVRGEWRKFNGTILESGDYMPNDNPNTSFDLAAINFEENGARTPVNYVIPPGIQRQINLQTSNLVRMNEQAMSMKVCGLDDGKGVAAFRNVDYDARSYKKIRMFVHAEAFSSAEPLNNGDVHLFVRLGSDYTNNYYEYEVPLKLTAPGNYNNDSEDNQYMVWPTDNEVEIVFSDLQNVKQARNNAMLVAGSGVSLQAPFSQSVGNGKKVVVRGNPNLSSIKTIMIGVRNPKQSLLNANEDDGLYKCVEVWVNELRLTDFDQQGGWAAKARVSTKLADLGTLTLAGMMSTPGFGSIDKKVSQRSRETNQQYDISTNIELSKFLPQDLNIRIPMYYGYSENYIKPMFNPLDPDMEMKRILQDKETPDAVKDSLRQITFDYTRRKSFNLTNVHKERGKGATGKPHFYDVENLSASYTFSEVFRRNITLENSTQRNYTANFTYGFQTNPKNFRPFGKSKSAFMNNKHMALIKDFNFYLLPNRVGFSIDGKRDYSEITNRIITPGEIPPPTNFNKNFILTRNYDFRYDLSKNIKLDFTATNDSRVMEPYGRIKGYEEKEDSIRKNLWKGGLNTSYRQSANLNWTIPINRIPIFDFLTATYKYSTSYNWTRASFAAPQLGHTIQNSQQQSWNANANMTTLYNKVPFFKKVAQKRIGQKPPEKPKPKPNDPKADSTKKKEKDYEFLEHLARVVMSVKSASLNYSVNRGTALPGFDRETYLFGMDKEFKAPTTAYVFGSQEIDTNEIKNGWLRHTAIQNNPFLQTISKNLSMRASVEPFQDVKIELTGNRMYSENNSRIFVFDTVNNRFTSQTPSVSGSFNISTITWKTAFAKDDKITHQSQPFEDFRNNRAAISERLGQRHQNLSATGSGYAEGYDSISQEVLIPAFIAAYTGKNASEVSLSPFPKIPIPNWRVTYDGLVKLDFMKKYFKTFTLSHGYKSTYSVAGFNNNLMHKGTEEAPLTKDIAGNFIPAKQITAVTLSESFSPLAKVDMSFPKKPLTASVEVKRDRNVALSTSVYQVTEVKSYEVVVGAGYVVPNVALPKKWKIKNKEIKSDLKIRADVSLRNNKTVLRKIIENTSYPSAGQNVITIKSSIDYALTTNLNLRFYYDRIINKPQVSNTFKTSNTNAGFSIRFNLGG